MLCWDHGTKEKPGSDAGAGRESRPVPQTHAYSLRSAEAPQQFQHTCGVQGGYRRAVRHTAGFVPNQEGRGGHGNRLSKGPSLARDLGLPLRTLYAVSNRIPAHYHRAEVPKRDGGVRVLRVPDPVLKDIQRRIARVLLSGMPVSPHATAYRYGAGGGGECPAACGPPLSC